MRDLVAGLFALAVLILIAVAPSWERTYGNSATAPTPTPTLMAPRSASPSATPSTTPISARYDVRQSLASGPGFAVCGASDSWTRPTLQEQSARVATDPRYRDLRFDDNSPAAQGFRSAAAMYDGAGNSSRTWLVMNTGLWSDPHISGTGCQTKEQQVWLFGLAPDRYEVFDGASAILTVHAQRGYRMVVITGEPRYALVVFDGQRQMKLELLRMTVGANSKAAPSGTPVPSMFPHVARPIDLVLYPSCQITSTYRHTDELGVTWYVQCGAGKVNVGIPGEAVRQGWILMGGDAPDGMQFFQRGKVWMQIFYRRDGRGIEEPFGILQTYRPLIVTPAPRPTP